MLKLGSTIIAMAGVIGLAPQAQADDDAVRLAPASPWNMKYEADVCRLTRAFGAGDEAVELRIDQIGEEPFYTVSLFGPAVRRARGETMEVQFGPDEPASRRSFLDGKHRASNTDFIIMYGITLAPYEYDGEDSFPTINVTPERETAIETISFSRGLPDPLILETGSLGEALEAMRTCSRDLVLHLGLDADRQAALSRKPEITNAMEIARGIGTAFPPALQRSGGDGQVDYRLTVDRAGKPTACQIRKSTRPLVLDDLTCFALMRMAEFEPALDGDGQPVASYYESAVRYQVN